MKKTPQGSPGARFLKRRRRIVFASQPPRAKHGSFGFLQRLALGSRIVGHHVGGLLLTISSPPASPYLFFFLQRVSENSLTFYTHARETPPLSRSLQVVSHCELCPTWCSPNGPNLSPGWPSSALGRLRPTLTSPRRRTGQQSWRASRSLGQRTLYEIWELGT